MINQKLGKMIPFITSAEHNGLVIIANLVTMTRDRKPPAPVS